MGVTAGETVAAPPRLVDHVDRRHPLHPPETAPPRRDDPGRAAVPARERTAGRMRGQQQRPGLVGGETAAVAGHRHDLDRRTLPQPERRERHPAPLLLGEPTARAVEHGAHGGLRERGDVGQVKRSVRGSEAPGRRRDLGHRVEHPLRDGNDRDVPGADLVRSALAARQPRRDDPQRRRARDDAGAEQRSPSRQVGAAQQWPPAATGAPVMHHDMRNKQRHRPDRRADVELHREQPKGRAAIRRPHAAAHSRSP